MKLKHLTALLFFFALSFSSFGDTNVAAFKLTGLSEFKGQNLSVYFVSGRPASLGTSGQEIHVNKVMSGPHIYKIQGNELQVEATRVPRDGWTSYNYAIFVVHGQNVHALTNIAYAGGQIVREPVRYNDERFEVNYTEQNQRFIFKTFRTSRELNGQPIAF